MSRRYLIGAQNLYGEKVADILIEDGVTSRIAENIERRRRTGRRASLNQVAARPGRHPPPSARLRRRQNTSDRRRAAAWAATPPVFAMANSMPWQTPPQSLSGFDRLGKGIAWCRVQPSAL